MRREQNPTATFVLAALATLCLSSATATAAGTFDQSIDPTGRLLHAHNDHDVTGALSDPLGGFFIDQVYNDPLLYGLIDSSLSQGVEPGGLPLAATGRWGIQRLDIPAVAFSELSRIGPVAVGPSARLPMIPAPGTLAVLALAGLTTARRRHRSRHTEAPYSPAISCHLQPLPSRRSAPTARPRART